MKDFFIGIDIGTSSTKVIATDANAEPFYQTSRKYPLLTPQPGYAEQDAGTIVDAIFNAAKEVIQEASKSGEILGIGLSCAMHGIVFLDDDHQPISNLITWADKRSRQEAAALKDTDAGKDIYYKTGTPIHPMTPFCKLLWFKKHHESLLRTASKIVSIKELFTYKLTGQFLIDHSIASATGMFDISARTWYKPALDLAGVSLSQF